MSPAALPLAGFHVGVTSVRRSDELAALLQGLGATVSHGASVRVAPRSDDHDLVRATEDCVARGVDYVVATTGTGFRGWGEVAEGWGMGDRLRARLQDATVLARGPQAVGAVRAAGVPVHWSPASETLAEVAAYLRGQALEGRRVVVVEHGEPATGLTEELTARGAEVVVVTVYRWEAVPDQGPAETLVRRVAAGEVDAVTVTSAPAARAVWDVADRLGLSDEVDAAFRGPVTLVGMGPVAAEPFVARGVPVVWPERARLGAMARTLADHLARHDSDEVRCADGRRLALRPAGVVVEGTLVPLGPAPRAVLSALVACPGRVLSRRELRQHLPSGGEATEHAVEVAVGRLRRAVGAEAVRTVVKRGYRLEVAE